MSSRLLRLIRVLGGALGGVVGLSIADVGDLFATTDSPTILILAWSAAWVVVGFAILPYLTIVPAFRLVREVQGLSTDEFVSGVLGLVIGLLLGLLLGLPTGGLPDPYGTWLPIATSVVLGLGMMGLTVAKRRDLVGAAISAGLLRRTPDGEGAGRDTDPRIVVDTSAIIDGRIAEIAASGFIYGTLVVPRFVLEELQRIADSSDALRRNRGRRGLEILGRMQRESPTPVVVVDDDVPEVPEVDGKLVALAKRRSGVILTNDLNLNRVAELQGLRVMNVNALANAVKPALLPGEELRIRVIQEGKEPGQGVGYLDDGTMIVVESGNRFLDREVAVSVVRVIQTVAGRMVFAQPIPE